MTTVLFESCGVYRTVLLLHALFPLGYIYYKPLVTFCLWKLLVTFLCLDPTCNNGGWLH